MTHTDDDLIADVAQAMHKASVESYERDYRIGNYIRTFRAMAHAALTTIRQFDEQAALNCGHCTPNTDEIACACTIKERDNE